MNEVPRTKNEERRTKSGVAIILVLGMLALLMIMATTFSITMRVERTGAGGFVHNVKAENLVWAGIARAIDDIDYNMSDPNHPSYPTNAMYPTTWQTLTSGSGSGVSMAWGEALDYIPDAFGTLPGADWINIATGGGNVAKVAYLVVNCSGFLDANYVGGGTRSGGSSPREIQIDNFPSVVDLVALTNERNTHVRYETLKEFADLQNEDNGDGGLSATIPPNYFVSYSRYPDGVLEATYVTNLVSIGGEAALLNQNDIVNAMMNRLGFDVIDANFVYNNLLDYLDADNVPSSLSGAYTEPVPMINEIVVEVGADAVGCGTDLYVEWLYPFTKANASQFDIIVELVSTWENTTVPGVPFITPLPPEDSTKTTGYNNNVEKYGESDFSGILMGVFPPGWANPGDELKVTVEVKAKVLLAGGAIVVDSVPAPWVNAPMQFNLTVNVGGPMVLATREAIDPRFNWDTASGIMWFDPVVAGVAAGDSRNAQNAITTMYLGMRQTDDAEIDETTLMYVSDAGELRSVGELGNLARSTRINPHTGTYDFFKTIRICDYDPPGPAPPHTAIRDKIYRVFTLETALNAVKRGQMNLNTYSSANPNIMQDLFNAVFLDTPLGFLNSARPLLTQFEVDDLRQAVDAWRLGGGYFENLDDFTTLNWTNIFTPGKNDFEIESLIANSSGLLGTRQNLFTIIVEANPSSLGMGAHAAETERVEWSPTKRAVVQVWRDPFEDAEGQHKTFIQSFRWLTDD